MNTTKKITVVFAVMLVAAMAAPAVMGADSANAGYEATVCSGQDTSISDVSGAFGAVEKGSTGNEIIGSFTLTNSGDWDADVDAKFLNHTSGDVYGMTNATEALVILGTSFYLGPSGSEAQLKATNVDTPIGTVAKGGGTMTCDAILDVPDTQAADTYTGTVLLTFSNA